MCFSCFTIPRKLSLRNLISPAKMGKTKSRLAIDTRNGKQGARAMVDMDVFGILSIIGTIAFAVSGAIVAMEEEYDIFGVFVLG